MPEAEDLADKAAKPQKKCWKIGLWISACVMLPIVMTWLLQTQPGKKEVLIFALVLKGPMMLLTMGINRLGWTLSTAWLQGILIGQWAGIMAYGILSIQRKGMVPWLSTGIFLLSAGIGTGIWMFGLEGLWYLLKQAMGLQTN